MTEMKILKNNECPFIVKSYAVLEVIYLLK